MMQELLFQAHLARHLGEPVYNMGVTGTSPFPQLLLLEHVLTATRDPSVRSGSCGCSSQVTISRTTTLPVGLGSRGRGTWTRAQRNRGRDAIRSPGADQEGVLAAAAHLRSIDPGSTRCETTTGGPLQCWTASASLIRSTVRLGSAANCFGKITLHGPLSRNPTS